MIYAYLEKLFGESWRTSLTAYVGAIGYVIVPIVEAGRLPTKQEWVMAAILATLGHNSKDKGVV